MTDRYESRATTHAADCWSWGPAHYECAVWKIERLHAEVEQLQADLAESDEIREKLGQLLTRTATALKGEPPEGTWHSWHDLPEKATQLAEALRELEGCEQRDEAMRAEDDAWCAECGAKLENVRPGKHQHPTCSQAQPLTDEVLLREALYALEYASDMTKPEDLQGCGCPICTNIAALRERLEGKTCTD